MADLPTAIFLLTDIVGSTSMWDRDADAMRVVDDTGRQIARFESLDVAVQE